MIVIEAVYPIDRWPAPGSRIEPQEPSGDDALQQELESVRALDIDVLAGGLTGYGRYNTIIRASDENGFEHDYLAEVGEL